MGPIETNLRNLRLGRGPGGLTPGSWRLLSEEACDLLFECSYSMEGSRCPGLLGTVQTPELVSEAIEAAEALGL